MLNPASLSASAMLTDLYQLTMAAAYWKTGRAEDEAVFSLFFRKAPFGSGFTVACGLAPALAYLSAFAFTDADLDYLATLRGNDGKALFEDAFLCNLGGLRLRLDVDAMPEGTIVFPQEPLVRVRGPILQAQLVETALLNLINYDTLIATKAARIALAAGDAPVLEFGLRRAHGVDGALAASRAAYVGGASATSNTLAGMRFGIPVRGTHAHSWVMAFDSEEEAFRAYADALPNNGIFLVDTYDSLTGVKHAIEAGRILRRRGHELGGIRLDSGDLAWLSIEARRLLDEAGFPKAVIVASNDLDERLIHSLKEQGAAIDVWGVGTKLATAFDEPALGGVYKLTAIRRGGGPWQHRLKLSEQAAKISNPGILQVRRFRRDGEFAGDAIYDELTGLGAPCTIVDPLDHTRRKSLGGLHYEDLLVPVLRAGESVYTPPPLEKVRERAKAQLAGFHPGIKRLDNPHQYPVGLESRLHDLKTELIVKNREGARKDKGRSPMTATHATTKNVDRPL